MFAGAAGGSVKMGNKRHRDNFIKVHGLIKEFKKLIFIDLKIILAISKNTCQGKLFVWYHNTIATSFQVDG